MPFSHFVELAWGLARHSFYSFCSVYVHVSVHGCVRPDLSGFVTCTIMHGFQNNLAQLLPLRRRSVI